MSKKKKTTKKRKKRKKSKKKIQSYVNLNDINLDKILLLKNRQVFLYGVIDNKLAKNISKKLMSLNSFDEKKPIILNVNSPGGSVIDGFNIIDTMRTIKAPVITYISGYAASMAGIVSITGSRRIMTCNSFWMGHSLAGGMRGKLQDMIDSTKFAEELWSLSVEYLKKFTELSLKDLNKVRHGALYLNAEKALKKGVIDEII